MNFIINSLRFIYGAFLIFSGFLKLVDPLGFSYKLQEYFEVFGIEWLVSLSLLLAIFVCLLEIALGLLLIFGLYVREITWVNLFLMTGFTFLTFYSAYFNAVTDCGCFGDFMKLDPWSSFYKDIVLVIFSIILITYHPYIKPLFNSAMSQRLLITASVVFFSIPIYALSHLPFLDFRPYEITSSIIEGRKTCDVIGKPCAEESFVYIVIDKENGDTLTMDSNKWTSQFQDYSFVSNTGEKKILKKGYEPPIHDFDIYQANGDDMTDSILNMDRVFLLISYDINKTNLKGHIASYEMNNKVPIYGLSSSSIDDIKLKLGLNELNYPYLSVDQTTLKTIVRSNPGLVLLENGIVVDKWHWRDIPKK
jgi:uncharacterized membrane protein YphA (DoxX/SURF4 family)